MIFVSPVLAQDPTPFDQADSEGVTASRDASHVYLKIAEGTKSPINIPRLAAPLRSVHWSEDKDAVVTVTPEQEYWVIKWKKRPSGTANLTLEFGAAPKLLSEIIPITSQADGCYYLPAHFATAKGEKVRYEPQSHKNTVGYWVGKNDNATWTLKVDTPGRFNVGILQGCGKGQGGSDAVINIQNSTDQSSTKLDFQVEETGHFQNFKWRTIGEIELSAGQQTLEIRPVKIANNALMDVRAIHLVRLPAPKK